MKIRTLLPGLLLLAGPLAAQTGTAPASHLSVDASRVVNRITPWLYGACTEDVNHEIYGGLYDQKIFGESFEEPSTLADFTHFKVYGGIWENQDGVLRSQPSPGAQFVANDAQTTDGAAEVDLRFNTPQGAFAGLIVRLNNPGIGADNFDGYEISLAVDGSRIVFGKHEHDWQPIRDIPVTFDPAAWNRLRVETRGEEIRILLNGEEVFRHTDTGTALRSGAVSLRNWDADVSARNFRIENPAPQILSFETLPRPQISWMWDAFNTGSARAAYMHLAEKAFNGDYAQRVEHRGGEGRTGIMNRSLNRWGIAVRRGDTMYGSVWLKDATAPVYAALCSKDGATEYAAQRLDVRKSGKWTEYRFELTPAADDPEAAFVLCLDRPGRFTADQVTLMNGPEKQFRELPLRRDVGEAMVDQGLTFLRYGGTMVNAAAYRFKPMIGDRAHRPPYTGHWYRYSTNGFGIEEFLQFCEAAGFEASFAVNIEESPEDMADMVEYLNGPADSPWGRKRAENGHPEPYGVNYIEIGNEEVIHADDASAYDHYTERFLLLAEAMRSKDPGLKIICSAWWRPESESMERVFRALDGVADYWDYHPWTDALNSAALIDRDLRQMQALFLDWNPATRMKCVIFEENGVSHDMQRAIVHATVQNAVRRYGDFVLTTCAANALQPYKQNDNGWDQGQVFFTPTQVWGMPTYYAQQLSAANHAEQLVHSQAPAELDATATLTDDGRALILHVVNTSGAPVTTTLDISGFRPAGKAAVYTLSGKPGDENLPAAPDRFIPTVRWIEQPATELAIDFKPFSYTVIRFEGQRR